MLRPAFRRGLVPLCIGLSSGALLAARQRPMRLDARPYAAPLSPSSPPRTAVEDESEWLNPEIIKQMSGGSVTGALQPLTSTPSPL